ncbi:zinc finger domain-containing protein [Streptomyces lasiicapitis]|uniref:zinc finger domain-containing protein n=1 Tax=Streptomyces lasiicapitis TaxID=1923961 RepID=UPI003699F393
MIDNHIAALLAFAGRLDSRVRRALADPQQSARTIADWTTALADVPATLVDTGWDASHAVRRYYEQRGADRSAQFRPVEPHDVLAAWAPHRAELMTRHTDPVPAADPDDPAAWRAELLGTRAAVATGHTPPAEYRAEVNAGGQKRLAALVSGVGTEPRRYMPEHVARDLGPFRPGQARREALVAEGLPDPLGAKCPHCRAETGRPCRSSYRRHRNLDGVHPSRIEAVVAQLGAQEEQAEAEQVRLARLMCQPPAPRDRRARHTSGGVRP